MYFSITYTIARINKSQKNQSLRLVRQALGK